MPSPDAWCPNCRQMISPRHPMGVSVRKWVFISMAIFMAGALVIVLRMAFQAAGIGSLVLWILGTAVLAFAAFRRRPNENYCPICKSKALEAQSPTN